MKLERVESGESCELFGQVGELVSAEDERSKVGEVAYLLRKLG